MSESTDKAAAARAVRHAPAPSLDTGPGLVAAAVLARAEAREEDSAGCVHTARAFRSFADRLADLARLP